MGKTSKKKTRKAEVSDALRGTIGLEFLTKGGKNWKRGGGMGKRNGKKSRCTIKPYGRGSGLCRGGGGPEED